MVYSAPEARLLAAGISGLRALIKNNARRKTRFFFFFMRPHSFSSFANNSSVESFFRNKGGLSLEPLEKCWPDGTYVEDGLPSRTQAAYHAWAWTLRAVVCHVEDSKIKRAAHKSINFSFPLVYL